MRKPYHLNRLFSQIPFTPQQNIFYATCGSHYVKQNGHHNITRSQIPETHSHLLPSDIAGGTLCVFHLSHFVRFHIHYILNGIIHNRNKRDIINRFMHNMQIAN